MNAPIRKFDIRPATRDQVPLLTGLAGPPGSGKTYSALTLASGMQEVAGGPPVLIDTEGGRSKKYADLFKFSRIDFAPPFRPGDFLAAILAAVATNPCAVIVDSLSDEHEGEGGVLDWHEAELERIAGSDWAKRERVGQTAWIKPKADRKALIGGIRKLQVPIIFCFRAREKVKQIQNDRGKMAPTNIGFMPIAPAEIVGEMDLMCVLPPKSDGVPTWTSDKMGEDFTIKLPEFFKKIFTDGKPITKENGRAMALWAKGTITSPVVASGIPTVPADPPAPPDTQQDGAGEVSMTDLDDALAKAAANGKASLETRWKKLSADEQKILRPALERRHWPTALQADAAQTKGEDRSNGN